MYFIKNQISYFVQNTKTGKGLFPDFPVLYFVDKYNVA